MSETTVMRLEIERGMYATFPENFKPYTEARAVVAAGNLAVEIGERERPVFYMQNGVVVSGSGVGLTDTYRINQLGAGMFVDNITDTDSIDDALADVLAGNSRGALQAIRSATFVGYEAVVAAVDTLRQLETPDAELLCQMAVLAVNYAQRDVKDIVSQPILVR